MPQIIMLVLVFPTVPTILFFDSALKTVEEALESAAEARKKTSERVDDTFKKAVEALKSYETKYHRDCERKVAQRMAAAKKKDITFPSIWDTLTCTVKEMFFPKVSTYSLAAAVPHTDNGFQATNTSRQPEPEPTKVVEFHLHKSLPARNPIIVKRERRIRIQVLMLPCVC